MHFCQLHYGITKLTLNEQPSVSMPTKIGPQAKSQLSQHIPTTSTHLAHLRLQAKNKSML
eukprot:jgi/Botrbrau1/17334/Bobra.0015s0080.1